MYAVIESGGKQHRVQPGDIVQVEKLEGELGSSLKLNQILFAAKANGEAAPTIWLGKPYLNGASVEAEIVGQGRGDKITIIKMKRRKQYRRTQGHRQFYTQLLITSVANGAGETAKLSAEDKKTKLASFQSHLRAKGPAAPRKMDGARGRRLAVDRGQVKASAKAEAAPKAKAATGAKKKAPAKSASKKAAE